MLIGSCRPDEKKSFDVEGHSLAEIAQAVARQTPAGWEAAKMPVTMMKGETRLVATATIVRRDGGLELEAETMVALRAKLPAGHVLVSVRSV
ncbi:hypothetical protein OVA26_16720 [Microbacterium sp. SL62]|uniref:hypothetical protein n=1 Tax=Microbacterium sp. SL62 TaxID=2995139 RepID=UPI0022755356|nr:hypothetical protein [Microbacterium sp. SL62]MCY1718582.1 hypothetical protein [Microbacterium sp. SL62]